MITLRDNTNIKYFPEYAGKFGISLGTKISLHINSFTTYKLNNVEVYQPRFNQGAS